jgi:hypothetical protein
VLEAVDNRSGYTVHPELDLIDAMNFNTSFKEVGVTLNHLYRGITHLGRVTALRQSDPYLPWELGGQFVELK